MNRLISWENTFCSEIKNIRKEVIEINIVYKITNKINNKFYIGSTQNFDYRMKTHFSFKRESRIDNDLYVDIDRYGEDNFTVDILLETTDKVEASREESRLIRQCTGNLLIYNKMTGASGRRVFYESDVVFIRELYDSKEYHINQAHKKYYDGIVSHRAFKKVWHGETFKDIKYEVYTKENKDFHFALGQSRRGEVNGKAIYKEYQVLDVRNRQKSGEDKQSVYEDYVHLNSKSAFDMIWANRNWKYIQAI